MISCKDYYNLKIEELRKVVSQLKKKPKLCVIQFGNDESANSYIRGKINDCNKVNIAIECIHIRDYENVYEDYIITLIERLNKDEDVDAIIIEKPIPAKYNENELRKHITPSKDVDGFSVNSVFNPCTPKGIIDYLSYNNYDFGKVACIIGRSETVGKPLARMLVDKNATVITCHSKTKKHDLVHLISNSDIVFTCIDKIEYFKNIFYSYQDIIDVGIGISQNDGKLHGNIEHHVIDVFKNRKDKYTIGGVGGVGLLTRIALLENVIESSKIKSI